MVRVLVETSEKGRDGGPGVDPSESRMGVSSRARHRLGMILAPETLSGIVQLVFGTSR